MSTLNELLTVEYENEYKSAYDLTPKKSFSNPKIYTAKGDLKKRWYVYFSFREPKSGKLKRLTPIYGNANTFKTKEDRLAVLTAYRIGLLKLLRDGYSPFEDNSDLYLRKKEKVKLEPSNSVQVKEVDSQKKNQKEECKVSVKEAFDFALELKDKLVKPKTKIDYQYKVNIFLRWLSEYYPDINTVDQLTKKLMLDFLNSILLRSSPRNRNNFRTCLSSLMQVLEDNEIIVSNVIKKTAPLKTKPKRNKTYTLETQEKIFEYLETNDPILLLFIKFVSFNFLRPIEVCRLKVKDLDLVNNTIQFRAKNSPLKTKLIPEILIKDLPDLSAFDNNSFLFTPDKIGGHWDALEDNKRDHFSKRFKKVVKDPFQLGQEYGLYSFRHTFITKLYRSLESDSSPFEARSKLMQITGHSSMTALEKYLRDIDAELPMDYSDRIS